MPGAILKWVAWTNSFISSQLPKLAGTTIIFSISHLQNDAKWLSNWSKSTHGQQATKTRFKSKAFWFQNPNFRPSFLSQSNSENVPLLSGFLGFYLIMYSGKIRKDKPRKMTWDSGNNVSTESKQEKLQDVCAQPVQRIKRQDQCPWATGSRTEGELTDRDRAPLLQQFLSYGATGKPQLHKKGNFLRVKLALH